MALHFSSCRKSPEACFTFSKSTNVKVGDTLTLVNCSTNYTDIKWVFPSNGISNATSPRVKMNTSGNYSVQLIVGTGNFKKSNTSIQSIEILP
jgi:PKD repeat protein